MQYTKISVRDLPAFETFQMKSKPTELTIQSKNGDISMLSALPHQGLAIVGTRHPQRRSIELLEKTLYDLRNSGLIIVSGFARGIDARAHELAIQNGLRTIAVLGCGIEQDYPKENHRLRQSIIDAGGLVISQFANDANPLPKHFFDRNGVIAGISKATWVVEAAEVSGTLNTAKWTSELNRDLYATSCFPDDHFYQGNIKLLSKRNTEKYPIADSFFSIASFGKTWPELENPSLHQTSMHFNEPKSEFQRWVLELQNGNGECLVQTLMNYASKKGYTLGKFYHLFEAEVEAGLLRHDSSGRVEAIL